MVFHSLSGKKKDIELIYTRPGEEVRRPGISEGKLTLVAINEEAGVLVLHTASRTAWWGHANHYCPAGFSVFTFDPARVEALTNEKRRVYVSVSGQLEFQHTRKTWGDSSVHDARTI